MFKTLRFPLENDFLCFAHLNFRNLVIARLGATALELMSVPIIPVWARVSNFDIRISYFPACLG